MPSSRDTDPSAGTREGGIPAGGVVELAVPLPEVLRDSGTEHGPAAHHQVDGGEELIRLGVLGDVAICARTARHRTPPTAHAAT